MIDSEIITAVQALINKLGLYAKITIGALPPDNGLSIALTSSRSNYCMNKNSIVDLSAVVNGKHTNQKTVLDALSKIHTVLPRMKEYPSSDNWQITNIESISRPNYLGREQNSQWLYGSSLRIKYYIRGE